MRTDDVLTQLHAHTLPDLAGLIPDGEWILPNYQALSIANIPATVAAMFGVELEPTTDPRLAIAPPLPSHLWTDWLPGLQRVVLIILDALGFYQFEQHLAADPTLSFHRLAQAGRLVPLTSVFPSTTNAALITLRTGLLPGSHGMLAYELYLREFGVAANMILFCPVWSRNQDRLVEWGLEPEALVPGPTLAERLAAQDIRTGTLAHQSYLGSGFSRMLFRGVEDVRGHLFASDLWTNLRHMLERHRGQRAFLSVYWGALDTLGHLVGNQTPAWQAELRDVAYLLGREFLDALPPQDREGTLLLITADHGMLHVPQGRVVTIEDDPALQQHLRAPAMGESRAAFLHTLPGHVEALRSHLVEAYPDRFVVLDSATALDAGLFGGPVLDETRARAGDLLVVPRDEYAFQRVASDPPLHGRHGGLSPEEMVVPFLGARLEAIK